MPEGAGTSRLATIRNIGEPQAAPRPDPFASAFAVAVLVLSTGAFASFLGDGGPLSKLFLVLWPAAYVIAALGHLDHVLRQRRPFRLPLALTAFVLLALLSTAWSVSPSISLRRGIALAGTLCVGLFLAQRLDAVGLFEALRRAALIVAVCSLLLYAVDDPRAVDNAHQTLRGVVVTKNTLGRVMAVGLIATAAVALLGGSRWRRCLVSSAPLGLALVLAESAGGAVLAVLGLAFLGGWVLWRLDGGRSAVPTVLAAVVSLVLLLGPSVFNTQTLLSLTGRDPSLTGRTDIWAQSLLAAREHPWLGQGFGAFWAVGTSPGSEGAARIAARLDEPVANSHNGLLDVLLTTGLIGVGLAFIVLAQLLLLGVRDARCGRVRPAALRLIVLFLLLVSTTAESGLLQENALLTVLLVVAVGTCAAEPSPAGAASSTGRSAAGPSKVGPPGRRRKPDLMAGCARSGGAAPRR